MKFKDAFWSVMVKAKLMKESHVKFFQHKNKTKILLNQPRGMQK